MSSKRTVYRVQNTTPSASPTPSSNSNLSSPSPIASSATPSSAGSDDSLQDKLPILSDASSSEEKTPLPPSKKALPLSPSTEERKAPLPSSSGKGDYGSREEWCSNFSSDKIEITNVTEARSNCVVVFGKEKGKLNPKEIVIKITLADPPNNNSLSVERTVYREIVPELLQTTPHLVKYIDDFSCPKLKTSLRKMFRDDKISMDRRTNLAEIYYQLASIKSNSKRYEDIKIGKEIKVLITEKAPGMAVATFMESALYKYFFTPEQKWEFERDVSLQVAVTLMEMAEKKIMHNDLHLGNIIVEQRPRFKLPYSINDKDIYSQYFVRFYDWDHSSVQDRVRNTYLDNAMCRKFGECNKFLPKWDWFTFLDGINYHNENSRMQAYFPDFAKFPEDEEYKAKGLRPHRGRACLCIDEDCGQVKLQQSYLDAIPSLGSFIKSIVRNM
jgi:hypothetical protein